MYTLDASQSQERDLSAKFQRARHQISSMDCSNVKDSMIVLVLCLVKFQACFCSVHVLNTPDKPESMPTRVQTENAPMLALNITKFVFTLCLVSVNLLANVLS